MGTATLKGSGVLVVAAALFLLATQGGPGPSSDEEDERRAATLKVYWPAEGAEDEVVGRIKVRYRIGNGPIVTEQALDRFRVLNGHYHGWVLELDDYEPGTELRLQGDKSGAVDVKLYSQIKVKGGGARSGSSTMRRGGEVVLSNAPNFTQVSYPANVDEDMWE